MRFSLLGAAQALALCALALSSGCGSTPLKKDASVEAPDLVGCYEAPGELSLALNLRLDQSFALSVVTHLGPIHTFRGNWSHKGNRVFLAPSRPISSVMKINGSLLISRLHDQYTLRFRDVRGNQTSEWDELRRTSGCSWPGDPNDD